MFAHLFHALTITTNVNDVHFMRKGSTTEIIAAFMGIILFIAFIIFSTVNVSDAEEIQDVFSDENLEIALFNNFLTVPCTNNNLGGRVELRKFIVDQLRISSESDSATLSCVDIGNIKYRVDIKDLESKQRWTFSNYQPLAPEKMNPDFDMIIQINTNSEPAKYEGGYILLDEYHTAILAANIETNTWTDKLQDEMFCDNKSEDKTSIAGSDSNHISHIYKYTANNCLSENCIKGPGQANATCQTEECAYSKKSGDECSSDCECETFDCTDEQKCAAGSIPDKLILGQPCLGEFEDSCESEVCAINRRCAEEYESIYAHLSGTIFDYSTGEPIEGALIEIPENLLSAESDVDGDYLIQNIELSTVISGSISGYMIVKITKDGYEDYEKSKLLYKSGQSTQLNVWLKQV